MSMPVMRFLISAGRERILYHTGCVRDLSWPEWKIYDIVRENEMYGSSRLEEALNCHREKTPEELLPEIKRDVELFVKDAPQFDDITMLCL